MTVVIWFFIALSNALPVKVLTNGASWLRLGKLIDVHKMNEDDSSSLVPDESMATQNHVIAVGKVGNEITRCKIELILFRLDNLPLFRSY